MICLGYVRTRPPALSDAESRCERVALSLRRRELFRRLVQSSLDEDIVHAVGVFEFGSDMLDAFLNLAHVLHIGREFGLFFVSQYRGLPAFHKLLKLVQFFKAAKELVGQAVE